MRIPLRPKAPYESRQQAVDLTKRLVLWHMVGCIAMVTLSFLCERLIFTSSLLCPWGLTTSSNLDGHLRGGKPCFTLTCRSTACKLVDPACPSWDDIKEFQRRINKRDEEDYFAEMDGK
ncbi:hypothetical protein PHSY_005209 [Pseudozyma hubeiensis SY62]|uniref:Uncharacterized protein n=1 Tax=Pseudozyma hubeiensis (strain SY62) TaxID=1305764 RepID=R9P8A1_PSEHS|nr:hypothetical protein PHSY_005209 [Pseudozyma hubeiensis SY62]GAC97623.1 hypothetical protein PHSY_005209 [Pseudozyma hubeiensis SY62]